MISQIKACILKQIWETKNNKKRLLLSLLLNSMLILFFFLQTQRGEFLGLDFVTLLLVYIVIWNVMMGFALVNDIIVSANKDGVTEQIFLSACSISKYTLIQVVYKSVFSTAFMTFLLSIVNLITKSFPMETILSFAITLIVGEFSIVGIGYLIASISLMVNYRNASMIIRLLFLYIILRLENNVFMPFITCKEMLAELLLCDLFLWEQELDRIIGLFGNSLAYFLIGFVIFKLTTEKKNRIMEDF